MSYLPLPEVPIAHVWIAQSTSADYRTAVNISKMSPLKQSSFKKSNVMSQKCRNKLNTKWMVLLTHKLMFIIIFIENFDAVKTLRIYQSRP